MNHSYIGKYSDLNSPIHHRDPRAKIIVFIAFILLAVTTNPKSFIIFALYGIFIICLITLSRVPIWHIIKRLGVAMPVVFFIAIFIPFLKEGNIVWQYNIGINIKITNEGLLMFWNVMIKAFFSVICLTLLVATTSFIDLLKGFELLKMPKLIVMVISFMYRYIFVLQDELMIMLRAKDSRSTNNKKWFNIKALSNMLGLLFIRSYERGEAIYNAMCSRGFEGNIITINDVIFGKKDLLFIMIAVLPLIAIRIFGVL